MSDKLNASDVARVLGMSAANVRTLDSALRPARSGNGRRSYDPARVEAVRAARALLRGEE